MLNCESSNYRCTTTAAAAGLASPVHPSSSSTPARLIHRSALLFSTPVAQWSTHSKKRPAAAAKARFRNWRRLQGRDASPRRPRPPQNGRLGQASLPCSPRGGEANPRSRFPTHVPSGPSRRRAGRPAAGRSHRRASPRQPPRPPTASPPATSFRGTARTGAPSRSTFAPCGSSSASAASPPVFGPTASNWGWE